MSVLIDSEAELRQPTEGGSVSSSISYEMRDNVSRVKLRKH